MLYGLPGVHDLLQVVPLLFRFLFVLVKGDRSFPHQRECHALSCTCPHLHCVFLVKYSVSKVCNFVYNIFVLFSKVIEYMQFIENYD
ncbi:hypothetical protein BC01_117 [Bacillus phage BC01]|nr:hypothetical protein BC01_117 [Bacillus phage BC01]